MRKTSVRDQKDVKRPSGVSKQAKVYERSFRRATNQALQTGRFDSLPEAPREVSWRIY